MIMSERERRNAERAYEAATQGMVLLRNENGALPINKKGKAALLGLGAVRTVRGGTGSGDPFNGGLSGGGKSDVDQSPRYNIHILDAFEKGGYEILGADALRAYAEGYDRAKKESQANPMATFAYPEMALDDDSVRRMASQCETAVYVLSRNAGEGADRKMTKTVHIGGKEHTLGDYLLCEREIENLRKIKKYFMKTVLVLNVGGIVDLRPVMDIGIDAVLLMGQAGQEGGRAVRDVLNATVNPSGKLAATWARQYADYPASATFADNDGDADLEKYEEGIYVGYRYFDGFGIEPLYEFGYGQSYTEFTIFCKDVTVANGTVNLRVSVANTGTTAGREVVQAYFSAPETELEMPVQELIAFKKTHEIPAGQRQDITLSFPVREMASFDEKRETYIVSKGDFTLRIGNSSRNAATVCTLRVPETILTERVRTEYPLLAEMKEISRKGKTYYQPDAVSNCPVLLVNPSGIPAKDSRSSYHEESVTTYTNDPSYRPVMPYEKSVYVDKKDITLRDVQNGKASLEELVAQMTSKQLASLNCGTGWGVADEHNPVVGGSSESVPGAAGETTRDLMEPFGIPSMIVADGPGGIRVAQEFEATDTRTGEKVAVRHYCTAWPVGFMLAQSFDEGLLDSIGQGFAEELEELGIAIVLGPGMNLMRDPLCGRNFEYFSEDPRLSGRMAAAIIRGIQSRPGIGACIKHFAANNQETNRNTVDTWISQRTLREMYLRGFEIAVKESQPMSIMTSYNLINGVPTADSYDLCMDIARGEWCFKGLIMTDWNGGSSTPSKSMHAGNDLIMPGGALRVQNILLALDTYMPEFDERGQVKMVKPIPFLPILYATWNSFTPDKDGTDTVETHLAEGHKAEVKDGSVLVDGAPVYTQTHDFKELMEKREGFFPFHAPLTADMASVSEDGMTITYKGTINREKSICLGDVQRCAMNNLRVIMGSIAMKGAYPHIPLPYWK